MAQVTTQYELNFRDYWRIIRKRRILILVVFVAVLSVSIYNGSKEVPEYRASSTIKLEQRQTIAGAILESSMPWSTGDPMESTAKMIESRPIAERAALYLGWIREEMPQEQKEAVVGEIQGAVSTVKIEETNLIQIIATDTDPRRAMEIANATAEVFVQWDLSEKNKQARKVREFVETQLATVEKQLHASEEALRAFKETGTGSNELAPLNNQLIGLKTELAELLIKATEKHPQVIRLKQRIAEVEKQIRTIPGGETEYNRLVREVDLNVQLYTLFKQKFEEARITEAEKVSDVSIVESAKLPGAPVGGQKRTTIILGVVIGLLLGFILAFVVETLDTSISTIEGVEALLSVPVLAVIPRTATESSSSKKKWAFPPFPFRSPTSEINHKARLIVHDNPKSAIAESYRSLRTNLKFSEEVTGKSLVITSAGPQEGKTTVLINLGLTTAQMGSKTLLVDADLRRPTIYKTFQLKREPGLYELLTGGLSWQESIRSLPDMLLGGVTLDEASKTPGLDHLFILPSGHIPLNPSETLGSKEMDLLLSELKKHFDVVLYDTPPILPVTDAALLAPKVDGVVIVYEIGKTARSALLRAKQQIESSGGKVLGIVLNHIKAETESAAGYPYYHYKYYGEEKKARFPEEAEAH